MNSIKTKHKWYPNTSISFDANGVWLRVSLNIKPHMAKYLSPNNVQKGKHKHVYNLKMHVPSEMISRNSMENVQKLLLHNCMTNIRKAEAKWMKQQ